MNNFIKYCLFNELDTRRINLVKDVSSIKLHKNEAHVILENSQLKIPRIHEDIDSLRLNFFIQLTQQTIQLYKLHDLNFSFIVNLNDGPENEASETRFCFARPRNSPHICIPDSHITRLSSICETLPSWDIPFDEKADKMMFIGSDTGRKYPDGTVQRVNFCKRYQNSEQIVAKINNFIEQPFDPIIYSETESIRDQLKYKYLLNINGNTTSWERLIWIMKSNSFCVFLKPPAHQDEISWYYHCFDMLQPFIYVDELTVDNFMECAKTLHPQISLLKDFQKSFGNMLGSLDSHVQYYAAVLSNYNELVKT